MSQKPVLLFGPIPEEKILPAAHRGITFTVGSLEYGKLLSEKMKQVNMIAQCHLKIDTGLNRSGLPWRDASSDLSAILCARNLPNLEFTGCYTHLACGDGILDWEQDFTALQISRFEEACEAIRSHGFSLGIRHCAATGGALVHPEYRMDMVRLGMLPMGMSYSDESVDALNLTPALTWVSYVRQIKAVRAGEPISYGCTFCAPSDMRIGIVSCGYADGYRRAYSGKSSVLIGGVKVPVVGRIAMDYTMVDLTDVENAGIGMPVILLGADGENMVTAQELSPMAESVSGEVTCAISARVPRLYSDILEEVNDTCTT